MRRPDGGGAHETVRSAFCSRPMMASRHSEWGASQTGVDGTIPLIRRLFLNNLLLAKERLRAQVSCKKQIGKARMSLMLFWGVGFAAFGWLVFKIADRM